MKKSILTCGLLLFLSTLLCAQELKVESFEKLERDLLARTSERLDLNDVPCAVLRVSVADAQSFTFAGNIIGDISYQPGEAIVYLTDRTRKIRINSDKFGTLEYEFPERLAKSVVYKLTLSLIVPESKKTRTLVMPTVGIGKAMSYGVMVGIVRKWGGYVKAKYSFTNLSTDASAHDNGVIEGTSSQAWYTGNDHPGLGNGGRPLGGSCRPHLQGSGSRSGSHLSVRQLCRLGRCGDHTVPILGSERRCRHHVLIIHPSRQSL